MSQDIAESLKLAIGPSLLSISFEADNRISAELEGPAGQAVEHLVEKLGSRLITITAVDRPAFHDILYHFDITGKVLTLRTKLWKPEMEAASISEACPAAEMIEQEITELFGIGFIGNPRPDNLILPEDNKTVPLRNRVSSLENRIDRNVQTIVLHGSVTAPSRRVMRSRARMGMPENPPLCPVMCPAKSIVFDIAERTGSKSRHPGIKKEDNE